MSKIIGLLDASRAGLFSVASALPARLWRVAPRPGAWSAAEVFAHLKMVEDAIAGGAERLLPSAPRPIPLFKRPHVPVWFAQFRQLKAKTPIPLDPSLVADREESISRHAAIRARTVALLEEHRDRDLSPYYWRHPFFGYLNFYSWFKLVAYHDRRHALQIQEIVDSFKK